MQPCNYYLVSMTLTHIQAKKGRFAYSAKTRRLSLQIASQKDARTKTFATIIATAIMIFPLKLFQIFRPPIRRRIIKAMSASATTSLVALVQNEALNVHRK